MAQLLPSESTSFTLDNMGRFLCNTLPEARDSARESVGGRTRDFDVIIIGGGTFGSVVAEHLFIADTTRSRRILVLEAGPFVLPEHFQNMPYMGGAPDMRVPWANHPALNYAGPPVRSRRALADLGAGLRKCSTRNSPRGRPRRETPCARRRPRKATSRKRAARSVSRIPTTLSTARFISRFASNFIRGSNRPATKPALRSRTCSIIPRFAIPIQASPQSMPSCFATGSACPRRTRRPSPTCTIYSNWRRRSRSSPRPCRGCSRPTNSAPCPA